jgi:peptidylprolyl isomerase
VVIAKGTGAPAVAGDILVQYVVTSWDGTQTESSWPGATSSSGGTPGPQKLPLDSTQSFAGLLGVPIGSRVYLELPADSSSGQPALAFVFDLVLQADVTATTPTTGASGSATDSGAPSSSAAPTS